MYSINSFKAKFQCFNNINVIELIGDIIFTRFDIYLNKLYE